MAHRKSRWAEITLKSIRSSLDRNTTKDADGCWIYGAQEDVIPCVRIQPVKQGRISIRYVSAFLFLDYDLDQGARITTKCGKKKCWNPGCLEIK